MPAVPQVLQEQELVVLPSLLLLRNSAPFRVSSLSQEVQHQDEPQEAHIVVARKCGVVVIKFILL